MSSAPLFAADVSLRLDASDLSERAQTVEVGEALRLEAVSIRGAALDLELRRVEVFTADARVVLHTEDGDKDLRLPSNAYFRGHVVGAPQSAAYLTVLERGGSRGLVMHDGGMTLLGDQVGPGAGRAGAAPIDLDAMSGPERAFSCGTEGLESSAVSDALHGYEQSTQTVLDALGGGAALRAKTLGGGEDPAAFANPNFTARIAFETDNEFLDLFQGDASEAADYVGDLVLYSSGVYATEIDTSLAIAHLSLWQADDPWEQFSTACGLFEFGDYWNDNNSGIDRTAAHFLSGKNNGGGIAWVGVLCSGGGQYDISPFGGCPNMPNNDDYFGAYGYSGTMDGDFDLDNPTIVWDVVVFSHELGHNFNSPHTHCYAGIGGNNQPVDQCYGSEPGCYGGPTSLPCGSSGAGCGTLMSYCHLLGGGIANMSPTFGLGHPWGVEPERVPTRMNDHVVSRANSNPSCLAVIDNQTIFEDGFEGGTVFGWDLALP